MTSAGLRPIGILGGMGPLAAAAFHLRLLQAVHATRDQDQLPVILANDPRIPDRIAAIRDGNEAPVLDALIARAELLERAGCGAIAMPCSTAHHWMDRLAPRVGIPFITMPAAVLARLGPGRRRILMMGTRVTSEQRIYAALEEAGHALIVPAEAEQQAIEAVILDVKQGAVASAAARFGALLAALDARNAAGSCLLACTELPVALEAMADPPALELIDATAALVDAVVDWARRQGDARAQSSG